MQPTIRKIGTEFSKLAELRGKTDRQLAEFISRRLDSGLRIAGFSADRARAEDAFAEASSLFPWVRSLTYAERRLLERKLATLREVLNSLSSDAELKMQTAYS